MGEPWVIIPPGLTIEDVRGVWNAEGEHIATFHDADARRRALACVNALEGWTTEALEQLAAPLADQLRKRDERIRKLEEAARAAYAHVIELQDAWIRGVLSEHDGLGGIRSNRNDDVLHLITHALGEG